MSERFVEQSREQARTHTHLLGPTGTGKTSLLVSMALDDLEQGVAVVPWTDPKDGQGADAFLSRIPSHSADRTVLFDPNRLDYAVGLNVLECADPERADIVVEQVLAVFEQLFKDVWGHRQAEVLQMALTTLLLDREATLCDLPRLLLDATERRRRLRHAPADLQAFWQHYEGGREIAPLLGRLQSLLLRPRVRNVLGQRRSTVDLADLLDRGGILIARLPLELAGTSRLLGSFLFLRVWQVVQGRQDRLHDSLRDAAAYLDEGELFMHIRGSVASVFDLGRSVRWGIVFAHQRMGQLPSEMAEALDANALTKIVFRPSALDNAMAAARLVPPLTASELLQLQTRQAVIKLPELRPFVGRTPELPPPLHDPRELADHALRRWGRPRSEIESELGLSRQDDGGFDELAG